MYLSVEFFYWHCWDYYGVMYLSLMATWKPYLHCSKISGMVHSHFLQCLRSVLFFLLFFSLALDEDVASAKALYDKMKAEKLHPNELSLKRLAVLLKRAGEPIPFIEPPVSVYPFFKATPLPVCACSCTCLNKTSGMLNYAGIKPSQKPSEESANQVLMVL